MSDVKPLTKEELVEAVEFAAFRPSAFSIGYAHSGLNDRLLSTIAERDAQIAALTTERDDWVRAAWDAAQRDVAEHALRTSAEATCARLREERNAMLERMFDLCRQGRVASECVDTSHGVGWNACITWMDSALCAVRSSMTQADGERR